MDSILPLLIVIAMGATLVVLLAGIVGFAFSTRINERYSTRLMAARVILQGTAVLLFALMVLLHGSGQ